MSAFQPEYDPDRARYIQITSQSKVARQPEPQAFPNLPLQVDTASCQAGHIISQNTFHLLDLCLQELQDACLRYADSGNTLNEMIKDDFKLPTLEPTLAQMCHTLHQGPGIVLLTGLDPDDYTMRENAVMFAGISSHISRTRGFQSGGKILCHLKDLTRAGEKILPSPYSSTAVPFHTDFGDIVAIYVLNTAAAGGYGTFAPVSAVYNRLRSISPELLMTLLESDWPFDRPMDSSPCDYRPLMFFNNGQPKMIFSRGSLIRTARSHHPSCMPNLTEAQSIALDAVHFSAEEVQFKHHWKKGDLMFFNNRRLLHGREAFRNSDGEPPRHMLRLWLQCRDTTGALPSQLQKRWNRIFRGVDHSEDDEAAQWPQEPHST